MTFDLFMNNRICLIIIAVIFTVPQIVEARKIGYKVRGTEKINKTNTRNKTQRVNDIDAIDITPADTVGMMVDGSFMVASFCETCNNGYRLDQIRFSGFDKTLRNSKESFFIRNLTDKTLKGVVLYIDYRTPDGRQLTKRFLKLSCAIPPGETRKADIPSFDTQHSFYYADSEHPKRGGNPFRVFFDPVAYYLSF